MTDSNSNDDLRTLVTELARSQLQTQEQIRDTQEQLRELTNDVTRVLARSAILDDVLLELRDNQGNLQARFDRHLQNFDENQRTTNAALEQLTAILMRLTRNDN
jgi:uncharacterized protein YukE